jgi:pimeloyl-ACP methyl ester carboxylesterase
VSVSVDFIAADPPPDPVHAASTEPVAILSGGERLLGVLHVPTGAGPHPVVVLLHGFPGNERNFDLAQALRRAGYGSLVFHYRGSWGVGGSYSWATVLEDAARVVTAVREEDFAASHRLDATRVAVVGHSVGGFAALMTAAGDPLVGAVVSVACLDFGAAVASAADDPAARASYRDLVLGGLQPLRGTSGDELLAEMERAGDAWSLRRLAPRLADRPVLLIGAGRDTVTPPDVHHRPLVEAFRGYPVAQLEHHLFPTDHGFADHRVLLARTVGEFLIRHLPTPPGRPGVARDVP